MYREFHRLVLAGALLCTCPAFCQFQVTTGPMPQKVAPTSPTSTPVATTPVTTKPGASGPVEKALDVQAATAWTDTGIILKPGDKVSISGDGNLKFAEGVATPEGLPRTWRDVVRSLPLNAAGTGALIARIGDDPAVVPFLIGTKKEFVVSRPGRLFLGLNLGENERLDGGFKAKVQVTQPANAAEAKAADLKFDTKLFDDVPRRVTDQAGGKGDMVNFILIGSADQVKEAFTSGGWVAVDKTKSDAVMHAILATVQKQSYLEMPMSELYLFGRPQDFGFARAEPVSVVQTRHHLRVWKAPFQFEGQDVWIGAATHDMGFEKDQRNGSVTHKIDPNVDLERDFVGASLTEGGAVLASSYNLPKDPIQEAKTATGGSFHSDGKVLVMQLRGAQNNANVGH